MGDASCPVGAIANYFLERSKKERLPLTNMSLQKLVYIAYGWCWELLGQRLFEERIEAWPHGPVIPDLYHEFKIFGSSPIRKWSVQFDEDEDDFWMPEVDKESKVGQFLNWVWDEYGYFSASQLREVTHAPDTPWKKTYKEGVRSERIDDDVIREHFHAKHEKARERNSA